MAVSKEKRTKPCLNCKKSKVKCIYKDQLPCERCIKTGQSACCQFLPKLPSLKFNDSQMPIQGPPPPIPQLPPLLGAFNSVPPPPLHPLLVPSIVTSQQSHQSQHQHLNIHLNQHQNLHLNNNQHLHQSQHQNLHQNLHQPQHQHLLPASSLLQQSSQPHTQPLHSAHLYHQIRPISAISGPVVPLTSLPVTNSHSGIETPDSWRNSMELQMSGFGDALNDLTSIMKLNQIMLQQQQQRQLAMEEYTLAALRKSELGPHPPLNPRVAWRPEEPAGTGRTGIISSVSGSSSGSDQEGSDTRKNQSRNGSRSSSRSHYSLRMVERKRKRHRNHKSSENGFHKHRVSHKQARIVSTSSTSSSSSSSSSTSSLYRMSKLPEDFRDGFLLLEEAKILFEFFNTKISQQLFGFEVSKFVVEEIWKTSPILICAICYISSIHYPELEILNKLDALRDYLHALCREVLYKGRPKNEREGFNTIMALVMCSFWLVDLQMFTGLALQVAKEIGLNKNPATDKSYLKAEDSADRMDFKDRMKLWYLLYVLDGHQSITFNRQPLVDSHDYGLQNARGILGSNKLKEIEEVKMDAKIKDVSESTELEQIDEDNDKKSKPNFKTDTGNGIGTLSRSTSTAGSNLVGASRATGGQFYSNFKDMRLVSQVEYNQALNEAFSGNAWDLLAPASFGIPSKSNLELDKWMVSWTVLLAPVTNGAVWSSKSTLIYYNFAKMHINSSALRSLQFQSSETNAPLPKWDELLNQSSKGFSDRSRNKFPNTQKNEDSDSDDSEDDTEFISNNGLISNDESEVTSNIAVGAAETVLSLVLNDKDILDNLKYVPVHIHIMLYYASLLLIHPKTSTPTLKDDESIRDFFKKHISNIWIVKKLQQNINLNLPTDKRFGYRLINSLDQILEERIFNLKVEVDRAHELKQITSEEKLHLLNLIQEVVNYEPDSAIFDSADTDLQKGSRGSTPVVEKIYAWPGSNHGHP